MHVDILNSVSAHNSKLLGKKEVVISKKRETGRIYFNYYKLEETFDLTVNKEHSSNDNTLETSLIVLITN
ncbi:985_t:CDS:2 [Gigaspora margarita]|uniref:985_t:CDS:1 n=1 Tax=Gigaspora margarita TaxID=4874 RepID=A0ABN7V712_GIGMA|nr:985_t:CDS:2 [Gigaspora margarita]